MSFDLYSIFSDAKLSKKPALTYSCDVKHDDPDSHYWRASWNTYEFEHTEYIGIWLQAYPVVSKTKCGIWYSKNSYRNFKGYDENHNPIYEWYHGEDFKKDLKFCLTDSNQAFVKPTQDLALHSLAYRLCRWSTKLTNEMRRAIAASQSLELLFPGKYTGLSTRARGILEGYVDERNRSRQNAISA